MVTTTNTNSNNCHSYNSTQFTEDSSPEQLDNQYPINVGYQEYLDTLIGAAKIGIFDKIAEYPGLVNKVYILPSTKATYKKFLTVVDIIKNTTDHQKAKNKILQSSKITDGATFLSNAHTYQKVRRIVCGYGIKGPTFEVYKRLEWSQISVWYSYKEMSNLSGIMHEKGLNCAVCYLPIEDYKYLWKESTATLDLERKDYNPNDPIHVYLYLSIIRNITRQTLFTSKDKLAENTYINTLKGNVDLVTTKQSGVVSV